MIIRGNARALTNIKFTVFPTAMLLVGEMGVKCPPKINLAPTRIVTKNRDAKFEGFRNSQVIFSLQTF